MSSRGRRELVERRSNVRAGDHEVDAPNGSLSDLLVVGAVLLVLFVAAVNPGNGKFSGMYVGASVAVVLLISEILRTRTLTPELLIAVPLIVIIQLAPYQHTIEFQAGSGSRSAGVSVLFAVAVYQSLRSRRRIEFLLAGMGILGTLYAVYFVIFAEAYDTATARQAVEFSNANYTGFVLGVCAVAAAGFALLKGRCLPAYTYCVMACFGAYVVLLTGSRSAFVGTLFGLVLILFLGKRWSPKMSWSLFVLMIGVFAGLFMLLSSVMQGLSEAMTSFSPFARGVDTIDNLAGRSDIWPRAWDAFLQSPFLGWGVDQYTGPMGVAPGVRTHSWILEYLASVGLLGTVLVAVLLGCLVFPRESVGGSRVGAVQWALIACILSGLALNTFQWHLWSWCVFGLCGAISVASVREKGAQDTPLAGSPQAVSRSGDLTSRKVPRW